MIEKIENLEEECENLEKLVETYDDKILEIYD